MKKFAVCTFMIVVIHFNPLGEDISINFRDGKYLYFP